MNRRLTAVAALALAALAFARPATLNLSFAHADDPSPRRFEASAQVLGLAVGLVLSWSQHAPVTQ